MSEYKYHSPFKRVFVTDDGGQKIKTLQEEFDKFWRKVNKVADKSPEKYHAMKAMQEACMWLTRACALKHERVETPTETKPSKHTLDARTYFEKLPQMKAGETITNNGVRIVIKPRKS